MINILSCMVLHLGIGAGVRVEQEHTSTHKHNLLATSRDAL